MAYSETFLGIVPIYWLLKTIFGSAALATNLLFIGSWVAASEFTYRLCRRLTWSSPASIIAALCFTYSTILLTQIGHPQIAFGAAFVPLCILLLLRLLERPS